MPKPRKAQVSLETTPYYHCVSRCVRRAFLCGVDTHTGKSYEHRRQWIVDRMKLLGELFAIDICAYAVMSNHYHIILHVDPERAAGWSEQDVIARWERLFSLPVLIQRYRSMETITSAERDAVSELVSKWRHRLHDISWFMRCINEPIARQANQEDGCTGRYWEGRYKSQALLDEKPWRPVWLMWISIQSGQGWLRHRSNPSLPQSQSARAGSNEAVIRKTKRTIRAAYIRLLEIHVKACPKVCHFG
ncbi:MAG: hypothetical protein AB2794_06965 [Candidatus Thiodiazotropha endolucinida]